MGQPNSKQKKKVLNRFEVEVTCKRIFHQLQIKKDRRIAELAKRERELLNGIKKGSKDHAQVMIELITIVNSYKFIIAAKMIMRYCTIIEDHSVQISDCSKQKDMSGIWDLESYFQGIIWVSDKLNMKEFQDFNKLVIDSFGNEVFMEMRACTKLEKELYQCFATVEPTQNELRDYHTKFCKRYRLDERDYRELGEDEDSEYTINDNPTTNTEPNFDDAINKLKFELNSDYPTLDETKELSQKHNINYHQPGYTSKYKSSSESEDEAKDFGNNNNNDKDHSEVKEDESEVSKKDPANFGIQNDYKPDKTTLDSIKLDFEPDASDDEDK